MYNKHIKPILKNLEFTIHPSIKSAPLKFTFIYLKSNN